MEIRKNDEGKIYFPSVIKFFGLWLIFCILGFLCKWILLNKVVKLNIFSNQNPLLSIFEVHNTGAAFNILSNHQNVIILLSICALIILSIIFILYSKKMSLFGTIAISLLNSGILLNLIERIKYGHVIDYFCINPLTFIPVFNIADIMIIIGAAILILSILKK